MIRAGSASPKFTNRDEEKSRPKNMHARAHIQRQRRMSYVLARKTKEEKNMIKKVTPFLWFDGKALEAAEFYTSVFKDSKIINANPQFVTFELVGQEFYALNGGPQFTFTEAISFFVTCETQEEVDELWEKLTEGGQESKCGWLKDKYGLSWQIIPSILQELLGDPDREKAERVMQAMLGMQKIDIAGLKRAYEGN